MNTWVMSLAFVSLVGMTGTTLIAEEHGQLEKAAAAEAKITPQTLCPVMGGAINKDLYVDHDGKRIYVCCTGCIEPIKKDPQKYIDKLEAAGITLAKLQTICPVMGRPIDKQFYVDHEGQRVYLCCPMCVQKFKADPEKYLKKMEAAGVVLEKTPATPVAKSAAAAHAEHPQ